MTGKLRALFLGSGLGCLLAWSVSAVAGPSGWIPQGDPYGIFSESCESESLEEALLNKPLTRTQERKVLKEFFDRCGPHLNRFSKNAVDDLFRDLQARYDYTQHPDYQRIQIPSVDGLKIPGDLFLKDQDEALPLIIIKCGVFCNLGDASLRHMIAHFYDEGPFHVLAISNSTGMDFQMANGVVSAGGLEEGRQLIQIAKYLLSDDNPFRFRIQSLHLVGISLGGNAGLFTSLFNSVELQTRDRPYFDSIQVGCPVVDLEASIRNLFQPTTLGIFAHGKFTSQMSQIYPYVPVLKSLWPNPSVLPTLEEVPWLISHGALDYEKEKQARGVEYPQPLTGLRINSVDEYWRLHRFQDWARFVRFPTFIWSTADDAVVPASLNSDRLEAAIAGEKTGLEVLKTPKGFHCNFASSYGWRQAGTVFRSLVLSQSSMSLSRELRSFRFDSVDQLQSGERRVAYRFELWRGNLSLKDYRRPAGCQSSECTRATPISVSWADVGLQEPRNEIEAQARIRFLNAHVRLKGLGGASLRSTESPSFIQITHYR